ncbi:MAG: amidohydrolase [Chitinophagaceae bacterium]|nr:amidohydrolase [Chitinophagaceae bacterium]
MASLSVTSIQTNLHWEDKAANLAMLSRKIDSLRGRIEVVILPEMFSTGFSMNPAGLAETMEGPTVEWMKEIALQKKIILTGSIIIEENGLYFNRLLWVQPDGRTGYYNKRHLFAFAGEDQHYTAGNKRLIASVKGWKVNLQVCYDLRFPVWTRQNISSYQPENTPEYDVLVYVANWPEKRNTAWKTLLQARAIENQCYVVGVNRVGNDGNNIYHSGDSMIVDPLGNIIYQQADKEDIFTHVLEKEKLEEVRAKFPFWKDADRFVIVPDYKEENTDE